MRTKMKLCIAIIFLLAGSLLYGQNSDYQDKSRSSVLLSSFSQLFIDDYIIEDIQNLSKVQHEAIKLPDPIIVPDRPWEKNVNMYGSVIQEGAFYRMFYRAADSTGRKFVCYAESMDGVSWYKPLLGQFFYNGNPNNNILIEGVEISAVIVDYEDVPERRYKMYGYYNLTHEYLTLASSDGISNWVKIASHLYGGDVCNMNYDPLTKQYVVIYKIPEEFPYFNYRKFWLATSPDLVSFSLGVLIENQVDSLDFLYVVNTVRVDPYGLAIFPYEGTYIGFNWIFYIMNVGFGGGTHIGPIDVHLSYNRNLDGNWYRPFRYPIIPLGEAGEWDDGMVFTAAYPTIMDDEIWVYYGGWSDMHGMLEKTGKIGIVRWRLDGFVSLENKPTEAEGLLVTKELIFEGSRLLLNADASAEDAYILAELRYPDGTTVPGFSREECNPINSNSIRNTVSWEQGDDLSELTGQAVVLHLYVKNANLFSLKFDIPQNPTKIQKPVSIINSQEVSIFPNPAKDILSISSLNNMDKITVFSLSGKEIFSVSPGSQLYNLDISKLSQGLYLLHIKNGISVVSRKFSKI